MFKRKVPLCTERVFKGCTEGLDTLRIQASFVMNSDEFGYVFDEFGFWGMAKTMCLPHLGVTGIPTKYPYYNIRRGNGAGKGWTSAAWEMGGFPHAGTLTRTFPSRILPRSFLLEFHQESLLVKRHAVRNVRHFCMLGVRVST